MKCGAWQLAGTLTFSHQPDDFAEGPPPWTPHVAEFGVGKVAAEELGEVSKETGQRLAEAPGVPRLTADRLKIPNHAWNTARTFARRVSVIRRFVPIPSPCVRKKGTITPRLVTRPLPRRSSRRVTDCDLQPSSSPDHITQVCGKQRIVGVFAVLQNQARDTTLAILFAVFAGYPAHRATLQPLPPHPSREASEP